MAVRGRLGRGASAGRGAVKAWVAAAKSAARASMVNQVAASRFDGVSFCSHFLPGSNYCSWLGFRWSLNSLQSEDLKLQH